MILINLLPHRQEKRQRRKVAFFVGIGIAAATGLLVAGVWYLALQRMIATQQERNQFLTTEIAKLEAQIKDIANLKSQIESLKARQRAVEDLQVNRNVPVYLLNDLAAQTPEGIYLTSIRQAERAVSVTGVAQTNERVSAFLRNTGNDAEWLERPDLIEIKAAAQSGARQRDASQTRLFDFSMRLNLKSTQPAAPADAASGPVAPAARRAAPAKP